MLPVLPRKRLSFVPLTQVFVLMQHFLPVHTQNTAVEYFMQLPRCLSRTARLFCFAASSSPPTHRQYQTLANQILRNCFGRNTQIQPNSRCHCWPRCCPPPRISGGELKCQTWKMYMCEFLPASACFYPQFNLGFCNWQIIQLQTIGNRTDAPRKALDWLLSVLL